MPCREMDEPGIGPRVGTGKEAEVFDFGASVIKRYRRPAAKASAFREAATLAIIETLGLPAPRVGGVIESGGLWGLTMTRAHGVAFGDALATDPELLSDYVASMTDLHRRIHACPGDRLPDFRNALARNIAAARPLDAAQRQGALERLSALPDGDRLCHGDFHPSNIVGPLDDATVVDWLDAGCGNPLADVCRSYVLMRPARPDFAEAYVEAYAHASGCTGEAILAWLPVIAAARLAEDVPGTTPLLLELVVAGLG